MFFLFQKESRCIDFTQYSGIDLVNPHVKIQFEINSQQSVQLETDNLVNPHVKIQFEINSQHSNANSYYLVNPHVKIQFEINSQLSERIQEQFL